MTRMLLCAAFTALAAMAPAPADAQATGKFDHLRTGFALTGAHQAARCDSCHVRGVFKGTPRQCASCHTAARRIATTIMSASHIPVTQPCESCHNTSTFAGARFSHVAIAPGSCASCHNGSRAKGKPAGHMVTTPACDSCHRTSAWLPAAFSHASVTPGTCATCHNGTSAKGKPATHLPTTASCDTCHRTTAWIPATVFGLQGQSLRDTGRNGFRQPRFRIFDLRVMKAFVLGRNRRLELAADLFNALDNENRLVSNANWIYTENPNVGVPDAQAGAPRTAQLSLRLRF